MPVSETTAALPQISIGGVRVPRMIVGCNQLGGWSHQVPYMTVAMTEYYTLENIIALYQRCEQAGLTACVSYPDSDSATALRTLWAQGSQMRPCFLSSYDDAGAVDMRIRDMRPLFMAHHGNVTDTLFSQGKQEQVHDFIKRAHDTLGIPVGMSAHNPDCIRYAADHDWEVDYYQCCLYYLTRPKEDIRAKLGGAMLGESFLDTDRDIMLNVIRELDKPCIAFKLLGAGWHCESDETVDEAFRYVLTRIKKTDGIIVGMWPKYKDEISQNVALLRKYGAI